MVRHTQTIRRQQPACLSVFGYFVGFGLKGLNAFFFLGAKDMKHSHL